MGFITPGKDLKERLVRTGRDRSLSIHTDRPRRKRTKKNATVTKSSAAAARLDSSAFEKLPVNLIHKIFVYAGPGNSLPLASRHLNAVLKFDPHFPHCSAKWPNLALALAMTRQWFLASANARIDFALMHRKLTYYRRRVRVVACSWNLPPSMAALAALEAGLDDIAATIQGFGEKKWIVLDTVLRQWFASSEFIACLNESLLVGRSERPLSVCILSAHELRIEVGHRLEFLRFKFKHVALQLSQLENETRDGGRGRQQPPLTVNDVARFQENTCSDNESIPVYDYTNGASLFTNTHDGASPILLDPSSNSLRYTYAAFNGTRDFPGFMYLDGIDSHKKLCVCRSLLTNQRFRFENVNAVLTNTFERLEGFLLQNDTPCVSAHEVVSYVLDSKTAREKLQPEPVARAMKVCSAYRSKGTTTNPFVNADLSKSLKTLLVGFYETPKNDTLLWMCVAALRDFDLVQLLMKFNDKPDYNVLHSF